MSGADLFSGLTMSPQDESSTSGSAKVAQDGRPQQSLIGRGNSLKAQNSQEEEGLEGLDADENMLNAASLHDPKNSKLSP